MPPRIYRKNRLADAYRKMRGSVKLKFLRAMLKKSLVWLNARREKKQVSLLCSRLQLPPEKLPQLFKGKKYGHEVVQELEAMVEMANRSNLTPMQTKQIFKQARTIEQARAYLEQLAQAA